MNTMDIRRRTAARNPAGFHVFPDEDAIPSKYRFDSPFRPMTYLVGGQVKAWKGASSPVYSPISIRKDRGLRRTLLGRAPSLTSDEALRALAAAHEAFGSGRGEWPASSISRRISSVAEFLAGFGRKKSVVLKTLMWEIAKPYSELEDEFGRTLDYTRQIMETARNLEINARAVRSEKGILGIIRDEPLGVALCMGPYNYPLFETLSLVTAALIMGNTVIIKPPRFGILFFHHLLEDFRRSFPPGAVNVIFGEGPDIIEPLMRSGEVDIFAFIGSAKTANHLIGLHPRKNRLRNLLGLEAKNAAVILPDANLDIAVGESLLGALAFNGQRCAALKIFFVHRNVLEPFLERMTDGLAGIRIGLPWMKGVRITPLADPERIPYLDALCREAVAHGGWILNRGGGTLVKSLFFPTLISPVNSKMRIFHEEQFGPVIPVVPYDDISAPLHYVSRSKFGQQVSVFGEDFGALVQALDSLRSQVSRININTKCQRGPDSFPFTGRKDSALGDFSSTEILDVFSAKSTVAARVNPANERLFQKISWH